MTGQKRTSSQAGLSGTGDASSTGQPPLQLPTVVPALETTNPGWVAVNGTQGTSTATSENGLTEASTAATSTAEATGEPPAKKPRRPRRKKSDGPISDEECSDLLAEKEAAQLRTPVSCDYCRKFHQACDKGHTGCKVCTKLGRRCCTTVKFLGLRSVRGYRPLGDVAFELRHRQMYSNHVIRYLLDIIKQLLNEQHGRINSLPIIEQLTQFLGVYISQDRHWFTDLPEVGARPTQEFRLRPFPDLPTQPIDMQYFRSWFNQNSGYRIPGLSADHILASNGYQEFPNPHQGQGAFDFTNPQPQNPVPGSPDVIYMGQNPAAQALLQQQQGIPVGHFGYGGQAPITGQPPFSRHTDPGVLMQNPNQPTAQHAHGYTHSAAAPVVNPAQYVPAQSSHTNLEQQLGEFQVPGHVQPAAAQNLHTNNPFNSYNLVATEALQGLNPGNIQVPSVQPTPHGSTHATPLGATTPVDFSEFDNLSGLVPDLSTSELDHLLAPVNPQAVAPPPHQPPVQTLNPAQAPAAYNAPSDLTAPVDFSEYEHLSALVPELSDFEIDQQLAPVNPQAVTSLSNQPPLEYLDPTLVQTSMPSVSTNIAPATTLAGSTQQQVPRPYSPNRRQQTAAQTTTSTHQYVSPLVSPTAKTGSGSTPVSDNDLGSLFDSATPLNPEPEPSPQALPAPPLPVTGTSPPGDMPPPPPPPPNDFDQAFDDLIHGRPLASPGPLPPLPSPGPFPPLPSPGPDLDLVDFDALGDFGNLAQPTESGDIGSHEHSMAG
ncbi:hypothetical protein FE257_012602 [Aspergillus nanangensis]|uniref:Zn(2)-C6 fungal-type domain-containing protein n=1 Tax=Aspergillus nanangensis TaxID=2582783 RepID=A0AAD4GQP9_ASPNN|nr:hypothetical protein FE257_012602 [Aspergillus nanangensis]